MTAGPGPDRPAVRVLVFARAPEAGRVKRRLEPAVGAAGAARVHAALLRRTLATVATAGVGAAELWGSSADGRPLASEGLAGLARAHAMVLRAQHGADLGARMAHALDEALAGGVPALLVGSDCPGLCAADLREAAAALAGGHDAVLGPAADGGYYLLGLRRPAPALFAEVPWGTGEVLARTRARLAALGLRWHELTVRRDVDRPEDLVLLSASGQRAATRAGARARNEPAGG